MTRRVAHKPAPTTRRPAHVTQRVAQQALPWHFKIPWPLPFTAEKFTLWRSTNSDLNQGPLGYKPNMLATVPIWPWFEMKLQNPWQFFRLFFCFLQTRPRDTTRCATSPAMTQRVAHRPTPVTRRVAHKPAPTTRPRPRDTTRCATGAPMTLQNPLTTTFYSWEVHTGFEPRSFGLWAQHTSHCANLTLVWNEASKSITIFQAFFLFFTDPPP